MKLFAALHAPASPLADLVDVAQAFTPRFEVMPPVVLLDVSGLSRLFGGAEEIGLHLLAAMRDSGAAAVSPAPAAVAPVSPVMPPAIPAASVAIASTASAAVLLAVARPGLTVAPRGGEPAALAPLPISLLGRMTQMVQMVQTGPRSERALKASEAMLGVLRRWGIRTLGALAALPAPELSERLGIEGLGWQRLARGEDDRPLVPWVAEVPFDQTMELEWPIEGLEPLSFVLARLFEPLAVRLERADRGAAILHTHLHLVTREVHRRVLQLPAPMRDSKTLRTLVLLDLESHPPPAAIDRVTVLIEPTPGRVLQWMLFERAEPAPESVSTLIARLTALMSQGHVGSPALADTWRPGSFVMTDFKVQKPDWPSGDASLQQATGVLHCAVRRFRLPVPARVAVREGKPVRVQIDRRGLATGAVVRAAGPWRTSGGWWTQPPQTTTAAIQMAPLSQAPVPAASVVPAAPAAASAAWDRDEWDVALVGGTVYRIFVERDVGQWFIEGVVD